VFKEVSMSPKEGTRKSAGGATGKASEEGFTAEERAAMKEHAKELKSRQSGGEAMDAAIAEMAPAGSVIPEVCSRRFR
jgi:hypothetical protein